MFDNFAIQFERPMWLALIALVIPAYLIARGSIGGLSPLRTHITFAVRAVVITLLAMALARPTWLKQGEGLTVMLLVDRSESIPDALQRRTDDYLRVTTSPEMGRKPEDRLGVITIGQGAAVAALPNRYASYSDSFLDNLPGYAATHLAEGVMLALASVPQDTAIRFVMVTDGNETTGSVLEAARLARANNIPIDCLPIQYTHEREVIFDRIVTPARAREGQVTSLRMTLRAQSQTSGVITLTQNSVPVDLDPDTEAFGMRKTLQPGLNTFTVPVIFDQPGAQRFVVRFEPDDPQTDLVAENNIASGVTFVGGEGRVLILSDAPSESEALAQALEATDLAVDIQPASYLDSLVTLGAYDAVIMINQHRRLYNDEMDRWLHDYVHDLGGGLIVIGGPQALGAGGWIRTEVEKALPLKLDPPQHMQRLKGALALIMHSCEMPQANFWGIKVAEAAINALSSLDIVGIVDFNYTAGGSVWEWGPAEVGDKSGPLAAAQKMPVGDMPDFQTAMQLVYDEFKDLAAKKHAIIISDGDPSPPSNTLLQRFVDAQITVTTVMIAGHGGPGRMQNIANKTGGNFYNVTNPRNLPEIFISESRLVARSLTVEGEEYIPLLQNALAEPIRGFRSLPSIDGYVLTAPKEGLTEIPFVSDKHGDPIYANWNYGIGKSVVFTPDVSGKWGSRLIAWDDFKGFWDQTVRWAMRPASPANMTVQTWLEGENAIVEVEAFDKNADFLNYLNTSAAVLGPEGTSALPMQQVGPGKYRGEFQVDAAGAYLINMHFRSGNESIGNLQAAVNVPYAKEFRAIEDNTPLLHRVAEITGGRVLPGREELADLWNRAGLEPRKSHRPIWDLLAILAAAIFIFDVAGRRLSIGIDEARKAVQRILGRRSEISEDTVAAWKKARSQVAHRRQRPEQMKVPAGDVAVADRKVRFEATEEDEARAIDVGGEPADAPKDQPAPPKRRDAKPQASAEDEGDFTSRLLAAKRRAREQQKESGGDA